MKNTLNPPADGPAHLKCRNNNGSKESFPSSPETPTDPKIIHCPSRKRLTLHRLILAQLDVFTERLLKPPQTSEPVFWDVCSRSTWRPQRGQRSAMWLWTGVCGQSGVCSPTCCVSSCWVMKQFDFKSLWRLNRSQISLNHCETGSRHVHWELQSTAVTSQRKVQSHWIKGQFYQV